MDLLVNFRSDFRSFILDGFVPLAAMTIFFSIRLIKTDSSFPTFVSSHSGYVALSLVLVAFYEFVS